MPVPDNQDPRPLQPDEWARTFTDVPTIAPVPIRVHMELFPPGNLFQWHGEIWAIKFNDRWVRVVDRKGLAYIRCLLRCPGQRIPPSRGGRESDRGGLSFS